jgi:hypothetical protein
MNSGRLPSEAVLEILCVPQRCAITKGNDGASNATRIFDLSDQ